MFRRTLIEAQLAFRGDLLQQVELTFITVTGGLDGGRAFRART